MASSRPSTASAPPSGTWVSVLAGLGVLSALALGLLLFWAAKSGYLAGDKTASPKIVAWSPGRFASLAWYATGLLVASVLAEVLLARTRAGVLPLASLVGQALFVFGAVTIGLAWAAERQKYWDAVHFASLIWMAGAGAFGSAAASLVATKRGSWLGMVLLGPACVCVLGLLLGWLWTWCPPLQDLQGALGRWFFLALHG
ncbi:MAG: hypothetical protein VX498_01835 [Myxococcota bacterium]|nr:hypothetical protein [Myxococcota bacterium]